MLAAVLAVAFLIALIVVAVNNNSSDDSLERICFTQECIAESAVVLRQMNESADPYVNRNLISFNCFNCIRFTIDVKTFLNLLAEHF